MDFFKTPRSKESWFVKGLIIGAICGTIGALAAFVS